MSPQPKVMKMKKEATIDDALTCGFCGDQADCLSLRPEGCKLSEDLLPRICPA